MSTSPIGTRVPTLSPNSIIRAGIPMSDNFNASDVSVTVESLLALVPGGVTVSSGIWTPVLSGFSGGLTTGTITRAFYSRVGDIVTCTIYGQFDYDYSSSLIGSVTITFPIEGSNAIGDANFVNYVNGGTGAVVGNVISIKAIATDPFSGGGAPFVATFQYSVA